ncbi:MAG: SGNH/GDSL hydrolase family protein, partial [Candidatus Thiodiazotropha endolucinida]|nr:SGNH/GDSL hydrolase family protein [Candidatus Thiodiazotropha taylori]MCW4264089.1 SGNH/GDSL hydrolase family protein [Candidatus Thiodiazotropha endolucinida]
SKLLQEQLTSVNTKLDILLQKYLETSHSQSVHEISERTHDDMPLYVTVDTTTEDQDQPNLAPGPLSYSDAVSNNQKEQGEQERSNNGTSQKKNQPQQKKNENVNVQNVNSTQRRSPKNTQTKKAPNETTSHQRVHPAEQLPSRPLIIGDSILSGVNRKGLVQGIEGRSLSGATIDPLMETAELYNLTKFTDIIVYVGGNDSSRGSDIEYFEEKYEQFITFIKNKNQKSQIYLCTSCPRGDTDVSYVNEVILRLCEEHDVKCIDAYTAFFDKNGKLRSHFYKERDNVHLSRSGVKRLLGTINQSLHIVNSFDHCAYPLHSRPTNNLQCDYNRRNQNERHAFPKNTNNNKHSTGRERQTFRQLGYLENVRCLKCGLTNHITEDCKHRNQVQCFICKMYGHKDSSGLCWIK